MKIAKSIFAALSLLTLTLFIYTSWTETSSLFWSNRLKPNEIFLSDTLSIDKKGELKFNINEDNWPSKRKLANEVLSVNLIFKYTDSVPQTYYHQNNLLLKINAYSKGKDTIFNRLVLNEYFPSNVIELKSLDNNVSGIPDNYNNGYKIGLINNFHFEDINIVLNILRGDSILNKARPRLLISDNKPADIAFGYSIDRFITGLLLVLSIIFLFVVFLLHLKYDKTI